MLDSGAGPELCAGGIETSLPPQCGGPAIVGWDWSTVEGETTVQTTTWGEYHLVGTYDGRTFTLTEPAIAPAPPVRPAPIDFSTPCPEPPGGWQVLNADKVALDDYTAFGSLAQSPPDFAGMWVDASTNHNGVDGVPSNQVFNVAYTGELDRHRAELAAAWGGPICVIQRPRTEGSLRATVDDLSGAGGRELGLEVLSAGVDDLNNRVTAQVMVIDGATAQRVDERYGADLVVLTAALQPVG